MKLEGSVEEKCECEPLVTRKPWSPDFALRRIHSRFQLVARRRRFTELTVNLFSLQTLLALFATASLRNSVVFPCF